MTQLCTCWHHPKREATHIANLGTALDLDTPVCPACAAKIEADQKSSTPINPNATVTRMAKESSNES